MPDFTKIIVQNAQAVKFSHGCGGKNTQKSQKVRASRPCPGRRTVCSQNSPNPAAFRPLPGATQEAQRRPALCFGARPWALSAAGHSSRQNPD